MLSIRTLLRHPLQFAIMVLGIALGVAVMVSIDLANASAARAFDLSASAVTGRATHSILSSAEGVDESLYVKLRTDPQWHTAGVQSAPLAIAYTASPQLGNVPFTILGIDPFAEAPFRSYLGSGQGASSEAIAGLLLAPGSVLLSTQTAERYGLQPCPLQALDETCRLVLSVNGETRTVFLTGLLEPSDDLSRRALDTLMLTDIATAQSLGGTSGRLSQIDLILPENFDTARLTAILPAGTLLVPSERRNGQVAEMTKAFQVNLTALSLLALVVGVFLIYNAMTFSVIQRRPLFGTLRSLGYTREQVFGMVLGEAAWIGALGAALGLLLGILLGQGAVQMVTQTINDLYFVLSVRGVQVPVSSLVKGGLAGLLASLLAAAFPAWEAASVPPRLALSRTGLEGKASITVNRVAVIGILAAVDRRPRAAGPDPQPGDQFYRHVARDPRPGRADPLGDRPVDGAARRKARQLVRIARPARTAQRDPLSKPHGGGGGGPDDRGLGHHRRPGDDRQLPLDRHALAGAIAAGRCLRLDTEPALQPAGYAARPAGHRDRPFRPIRRLHAGRAGRAR